MTIDVRNKGPETRLPTAAGPKAGAAAPTGITGAQALANAQAAFALVFDGAQVAGGAEVTPPPLPTIVRDDVSLGSVKTQIITTFEGLKSQHLQVKPDGPAAKAFSNPLIETMASQTVVQPEVETLALAKTDLPPQAKRAFDKTLDAFWGKKLENLSGEQALLQTPFAQKLQKPNSPEAKKVAELAAAVAKWAAAPVTQSNVSQDTKQTSTAGDVMELPNDIKDKLEALAGPNMPSIEGMNIEDAIVIMMMLLSQDSTKDLKEQLDKMQSIMKEKQVKRDMLRQLKDDEKSLNDEAKKQFEQMKKDGLIDKDASFTEFLDYCPVTFVEPTYDPETNTAKYTAPTIAMPDPIPESLKPVSDSIESPSGGLMTHLSPGIAALITAPSKAMSPVNNLIANTRLQGGTNNNLVVAQSAAKTAVHNAAVLGAISGPPRPTKPPAPTAQPQVQVAGFRMGDLANQEQKLQDNLDSLSAQSDIDQLKMQMYLDRRQKCLETASNVRKKFDDTAAGIIKNFI